MSPERVTPLLLRKNKMHPIVSASHLELPGRHAHEDLVNKLIMVQFREVCSREVRCLYRSSTSSLTIPFGNTCAPYSWSLPAVFLFLRFRALPPPSLDSVLLGRSPRWVAVAWCARRDVAVASCAPAASFSFFFLLVLDSDEASAFFSWRWVLLRDFIADPVAAPSASAAAGASSFF